MAEGGDTARSTSSAGFIDDTEDAIFTLSPSDNVYAYFMFCPPTEAKKEGSGITFDIIMAYILLIFNFCMQGFLLMVIYNVVVQGNIKWQGSIVKTDGGGLDLLNLEPSGKQCNTGGSLCFMQNNSYSCAPPSVQLTGRWEELDTNGDGIWTREEVEKAKESLQCKYVVNPVEVFDVFISFLKTRENILWLHPDIKAGKAIHKPYFWFAAGDIIMCGYRNEYMCPNLLKRGVFHAPLKYHTAPRVGTTIDSALDYCYELLKPGGTCQRTLPSTYSVWKVSSANQCMKRSFEKFVYENPGNGVQKSLLEVDYEARKKYALSKTMVFKVYKCIIISLWLLAMLFELKDVTIVTTWVIRFPDAAEFGEDAVKEETDEDGNTKYIIQGITSTHRYLVGAMNLCRFILTCVLTLVGVSFLLKQTGYIGLLMDAVALVFIVEIANLLYTQVLRPEIREQCEGLDPMTVPMFGIDWLNRRPALVDLLCLVAIMLATITVMYFWNDGAVEPIYDALSCACLSEGESCLEANKFSYDFWFKYWKEDIPGVFKSVDELKKGAFVDMGKRGFNRLPSTLLSHAAHRLHL
jgi:hypothetical protein